MTKPWNARAARVGATVLGVAISVLGRPAAAEAQEHLYVAASSRVPFEPLTSATSLPFAGAVDDGVATIPIGFSFPYYGAAYTHVTVTVNGALAFAPPCSSTNACPASATCNASAVCELHSLPYRVYDPIPSVGAPNDFIAAFLDDLRIGSGSRILYSVLGAAPERELVVEWSGIRHYFESASAASFQIRLREDGRVRVHYGPFTRGARDQVAWSGKIGIENANGSEGLSLVACSTAEGRCSDADLEALADVAIDVLTPIGPELVGDVEAPVFAAPGDQITVGVDVRNIGVAPTDRATSVEVYLSSDELITVEDLRLGAATVPTVGPSAHLRVDVGARIDPATSPGYYRLGAMIDPANLIAEVLETDNVIISPERFLVGADLAVRVGDTPPVAPGDEARIPLFVVNHGAALTGVSYAVFLSPDDRVDANDIPLAAGRIDAPAATERAFEVAASVPPDASPGTYRIIARIDSRDELVEADESNNVGVSATTSDIVGPDVMVTDVTSEDVLFIGQPYVVRFTLRNAGRVPVREVFASVHLSGNLLVTLDDEKLGEYGPISLAPSASRALELTVVAPARVAPGAYRVGVITQLRAMQVEENQANNVRARPQPVTVAAPAPDFVALDVQVPPKVAAGESFSVDRVIRNRGFAAGVIDYSIFLSTDDVIDPSADLEVGRNLVMLEAGAETSGVDHVDLPADLAPGLYFLGYVIDPAGVVGELDETNNTTPYATRLEVERCALAIRTRGLPILPVRLPFTFRLVAEGGTGLHVWSVRDGALPTGLALSPDGTISGTPQEEGRSTVSLMVTDGAVSAAATFEVFVVDGPIALDIATRVMPPAFVGRDYQYPLTVLGGVMPYAWTAREGLPAGLTLESTGLISGRPTSTGSQVVTVRVMDALGRTAERALAVRVVDGDSAIHLVADSLPQAVLGVPYEAQLRVEPGTGSTPFEFNLAHGRLPLGLELAGDRIRGTAREVGRFPVEVRVVDAQGDFDTNLFVLTVEEALGVAITTTQLPPAQVGVPYVDESGRAVRLHAFSAGRPDASMRFAIAEGALPAGLELAPEGVVIGTPAEPGLFSVLLVASDDAGQSDRRALGVLVAPAPQASDARGTGGCACSSSEPRSRAGGGAGLLWLLGLCVCRRWGGRAGLGLRSGRCRWDARLPVAVLAVLAPTVAEAQVRRVGPYVITREQAPYQERMGGQPVPFSSSDDASVVLPLPFPFRYWSQDASEITISTNGIVVIGAAQTISLANASIPERTEPNRFIAAAWDDLISTDVRTFVEGSTPNRVFIVQYTRSTRYVGGGGGAGEPLSFQIRLHEGRGGRIEVHYESSGLASSLGGFDATTGFEDEQGASGGYFLECQSACRSADFLDANDTVFIAQQDAGVDVFARDLDAPPVVYPGVPFDIEVGISAYHAEPIGGFRYAVHLLREGEPGQGLRLFLSDPVTLEPYQPFRAHASIVLPLNTPEGGYRLALRADADDQLDESNEADNVMVMERSFRVMGARPNFRVMRVHFGATTVEPGGATTVEPGGATTVEPGGATTVEPGGATTVEPGGATTAHAAIENAGRSPGSARYTFYLSRNDVISADDLPLVSGRVELDALASLEISETFHVPTALLPGTYFVGVVLEPEDGVREIRETDNVARADTPLVVLSSSLDVVSLMLPGGFVGVDYSAHVMALGGDGRYAFRVVDGALPEGLALDVATGEIAGRPLLVGIARFTLRVASAGRIAERALTLAIEAPDSRLVILTRQLLPGIVGDAYPPVSSEVAGDPQRIAVAGASPRVRFEAENELPPGLVLETDGVLHGTPEAAGLFELHIRAIDGTAMARRTLALVISERGRLALISDVLPEAKLGEPYGHVLRATGHDPMNALTFTTRDPLPRGLSLSSRGEIGGVPERVETCVFMVAVVEGDPASPVSPRDTATFMLSVVPGGAIDIRPKAAPEGRVGEDYEIGFVATGAEGDQTWRVDGVLPAGLEQVLERRPSGDRFVLRGKPTDLTFAPLLLTVIDTRGRESALPVTIRISNAPLAAREDSGGCRCVRTDRPSGAHVFTGVALLGLPMLMAVRRSHRRAR